MGVAMPTRNNMGSITSHNNNTDTIPCQCKLNPKALSLRNSPQLFTLYLHKTFNLSLILHPI